MIRMPSFRPQSFLQFTMPRPLEVVALIIFIAIIGARQIFDTRAASHAPGPDPKAALAGPTSVTVGEVITLQLVADHARDVGGYEATVAFSGPPVIFRGVDHLQSDLRKLGRDLQPLPPINHADDEEISRQVMFGAYTCPVTICTDVSGTPGQRQGAQGRIVLAQISIVALEPGQLSVRLDQSAFVDIDGIDLDVAIRNASIQINVEEEQ